MAVILVRTIAGSNIREYQAYTSDSVSTYPSKSDCDAGSKINIINPVSKQLERTKIFDGVTWNDYTNGEVIPANIGNTVQDMFRTFDENMWEIVTLQSGDFISAEGNTGGAGYVKISKNPFTQGGTSVIQSKFTMKPPFRFGLGLSLSQRLSQQNISAEFVAVDDAGQVIANMPTYSAIGISSLSQTTTTLTITTSAPHGLFVGDRFELYGVADSRLNYGECLVATVTSPTVFTVTTSTTGTIPSATLSGSTGYIIKVDPFMQADNCLGIRFEGTSADYAKVITRSDGCSHYELSNTSFGSSATVALNNGGAFCDSLRARYIYDFLYKTEGVKIRAFGLDSSGTSTGNIKATGLCPNKKFNYKIRFKMNNDRTLSSPVAKIVSAVKSGSTTATITTNVAHGLTTADYITLVGMRDQTNFANQVTAVQVANVVNSTTFTVVFGASATATSYGGTVFRVNGSYIPAHIGQSIQSITIDANYVTLIGNTNWSGVSVADTVNLYGIYNTSGGAEDEYEGAYKVANVSTTSLVLYNDGLYGKEVLANLATTNIGGTVIRRTDYRLHLLRKIEFEEQIVDINSTTGNSLDYSESMPVYMTNAGAVTASANIIANATINAETTTNLGVSATYTGTGRDAGSTLGYNRLRVMTLHTAGLVAGHLVIEQSSDNTTFRETHRVPVPSDANYRTYDFPILLRYVRVKFINGTTAQTAIFIGSVLIRMDGSCDFDKTSTFLESTTALAGAGTFTGTTLNLGGNHSINKHRAMVTADQTGTLYMEQSRDGSTWRIVGTQAVTANTPVIVETPIVAQYVRVRYVNGATIQGSFELLSALVRA